ncbi:MAG: hypothetical protein J7L07_07715 [Candidatus Odinarchaeota archaeon]|nr:hypothetical protein [Candidatus Odinarchaeota archaeon]
MEIVKIDKKRKENVADKYYGAIEVETWSENLEGFVVEVVKKRLSGSHKYYKH